MVKKNCMKTNISDILKPINIKDNNFILKVQQYENLLKNNLEPRKIPIDHQNIYKEDDYIQQENSQNYSKQNNEEMYDSYETNNKSQAIEISLDRPIQTKNNINFINKTENDNYKFEDNILEFDGKAESISMPNNQFFIINSSNNIYKNNNNNLLDNDFILEDIPINMNNNENYEYKWKKFYILYKEKNNNLIKNDILSILAGLINDKKNSHFKNFEILDNDNNRKHTLEHCWRKTSESNIINSHDNQYNISNSCNLMKITSKTQINNLSNLIKFNGPQIYNNDSLKKKINYQKTDISHIIQQSNILSNKEFKKVVDFLLYKEDLFIKKINDDISNAQISLDSGIKNNQFGNMYTINEEENESNDSLSINELIKDNQKLKNNKIYLKKNSCNNIQESINDSNDITNNITNNLSNIFNNSNIKDYSNTNINKNKSFEEIDIIDKEYIEKNNNLNSDKNESIDNYDINDNTSYNINIDDDNNNERKIMNKDFDPNNLYNMNNLNKKINYNKNEDEQDNSIYNDIYDKESDIINISNEIIEQENKLNYSTIENKEKIIKNIYEIIYKKANIKKESSEFKNNNNDKNNYIKYSDLNDKLKKRENELELKEENISFNNKMENGMQIIDSILIKSNENNEKINSFKKIDDYFEDENKNIEENINFNIDNEVNKEENIINNCLNNKNDISRDKSYEEKELSSLNIKNTIKDFSLNGNSKISSLIFVDNNKEKNDNNKVNFFDKHSNNNFSINIKNSKELLKEFSNYKIIDKKKRKISFINNNYINSSNIYSIPLYSYYYILQLCFKKKLEQTKIYEIFIIKLINKLERSKRTVINNNKINYFNKDIYVDIDIILKDFEKK